MTDLLVTGPNAAWWQGRRMRCAIGRGSFSADKREGDGATPIGAWPMRRLLWRRDRLPGVETALPAEPLEPASGWCDAPGDPAYNLPVRLPYGASAESLWREDRVYDLIVPLGYNDAPIVPGRGSAIFLHVARPDFSPTEGCVALAPDDLLRVLGSASQASCVVVRPAR